MAGNVWEWVADWYDGDYYGRSPGRSPKAPDRGEYRVSRGGSWLHNYFIIRTASRGWNKPDTVSGDLGCRCIQDIPTQPAE